MSAAEAPAKVTKSEAVRKAKVQQKTTSSCPPFLGTWSQTLATRWRAGAGVLLERAQRPASPSRTELGVERPLSTKNSGFWNWGRGADRDLGVGI